MSGVKKRISSTSQSIYGSDPSRYWIWKTSKKVRIRLFSGTPGGKYAEVSLAMYRFIFAVHIEPGKSHIRGTPSTASELPGRFNRVSRVSSIHRLNGKIRRCHRLTLTSSVALTNARHGSRPDASQEYGSNAAASYQPRVDRFLQLPLM